MRILIREKPAVIIVTSDGGGSCGAGGGGGSNNNNMRDGSDPLFALTYTTRGNLDSL